MQWVTFNLCIKVANVVRPRSHTGITYSIIIIDSGKTCLLRLYWSHFEGVTIVNTQKQSITFSDSQSVLKVVSSRKN